MIDYLALCDPGRIGGVGYRAGQTTDRCGAVMHFPLRDVILTSSSGSYDLHLSPAEIHDFPRTATLSSVRTPPSAEIFREITLSIRISNRCGPIRTHPFEEWNS